MADDAENGSLEVEHFTTASGSFIKYGYIVMRRPTPELSCCDEYHNWFQELRACASDAGLLDHFNGKAVRPMLGAVHHQDDFDQKRAAMNNFIFETVGENYWGGYSKEKWQDDPRNTQTFERTATTIILQRVKESFNGDAMLQDFVTDYDEINDPKEAVTMLDQEWANVNAVLADAPVHFYHFAAWGIAKDYDMTRVRRLYVESLPQIPSIEEVNEALKQSC
ncbi:hypothetical protein Purlil1_1812 [Purpureocillium lilacinum]|uniref:Uncharacterized protein n=1 Tax=Purpureocillium lilacinum TaxID=33203 RepID=A0ABR0CAQ1_PURLI|nr:hypothetical protein Purlil1_1812 [Purpureocillium lilacinum]